MYEYLVKRLHDAASLCLEAEDAISVLVAEKNEGKAMAEKAINDIYSVRPCSLCTNFYKSDSDSRCFACFENGTAYHPDFKWREEEDNHDTKEA